MLSQQTHLNTLRGRAVLAAPPHPREHILAPRRPVPKNPFCPKGWFITTACAHAALHG